MSKTTPAPFEFQTMMRRAVATDVDMIVAFETEVMDKKLYGKPLDHTAATSEIETNAYYLHLSEGRVVATGSIRRREDGSAYLSNIAVHPNVRRTGLARAMLNHLLSLSDGATSIDLAVHPENQAARALYVSQGFTPTHTHENFFGDGEPRLVMQRVRSIKASAG